MELVKCPKTNLQAVVYDTMPERFKQKIELLVGDVHIWATKQQHHAYKLPLQKAKNNLMQPKDFYELLKLGLNTGEAEKAQHSMAWLRFLCEINPKKSELCHSLRLFTQEQLYNAILPLIKADQSHALSSVNSWEILNRWRNRYKTEGMACLVHKGKGKSNKRIVGKITGEPQVAVNFSEMVVDLGEFHASTISSIYKNFNKGVRFTVRELYTRYVTKCAECGVKPVCLGTVHKNVQQMQNVGLIKR